MHVVGISALLQRDGEVLLVERAAGKPFAGRWSLPGGALLPGETLERAVRREVREETGLRIRPLEVVTAITTGEDNTYVVICFRAEVTGGRLRAGDDASDVRWVPVGALRRVRTTPGLRAIVERAMRPGGASASTRGSPSARTRRAGRAR